MSTAKIDPNALLLAENIISLADHHARGDFAMKSSAELMIKDAEALLLAADYANAREAALRSLTYSIGILHVDYQKAKAAVSFTDVPQYPEEIAQPKGSEAAAFAVKIVEAQPDFIVISVSVLNVDGPWPAVNPIRAELEKKLHHQIDKIELMDEPKKPLEVFYRVTAATFLQIAQRSEFGGFEHEGLIFTCEQHPYIEGAEPATYRATATDAAGNRYLVKWSMKPEIAALPVEERPEDDSDSCDWESPDSVTLIEAADMRDDAASWQKAIDAATARAKAASVPALRGMCATAASFFPSGKLPEGSFLAELAKDIEPKDERPTADQLDMSIDAMELAQQAHIYPRREEQRQPGQGTADIVEPTGSRRALKPELVQAVRDKIGDSAIGAQDELKRRAIAAMETSYKGVDLSSFSFPRMLTDRELVMSQGFTNIIEPELYREMLLSLLPHGSALLQISVLNWGIYVPSALGRELIGRMRGTAIVEELAVITLMIYLVGAWAAREGASDVCKGCGSPLEPSEPGMQHLHPRHCCEPECDRRSTDHPDPALSPLAE